MKKLSKVIGKTEKEIADNYQDDDFLFEDFSEEERKDIECKIKDWSIPESERIESPYHVRDMYLLMNDYDKFYEEHCESCNLGDHGGCEQCEYGHMIVKTREERDKNEFHNDVSDIIQKSTIDCDKEDSIIIDKNQLIDKLYEKFREE